MKKVSFIVVLISLFFACKSTQSTVGDDAKLVEKRLKSLYGLMTGTFNSADQAAKDTNYFDITLEMVPIWKKEPKGYWLYVEQAVTSMRERPYRQRVYHLQTIDADHFSSTVYSLPNAKRFIGVTSSDAIWGKMTTDSLILLSGCTIFLEYDQGEFKGATHENDCLNSWGKAAYATSEVIISEGILHSWDRGWDSTRTQVWGAELGGYVFIKH